MDLLPRTNGSNYCRFIIVESYIGSSRFIPETQDKYRFMKIQIQENMVVICFTHITLLKALHTVKIIWKMICVWSESPTESEEH